MMRILIPFVAALGLSLGVSTGVVMMRAPKVVPMTAADSAKADSLKADSTKAKGDSTHAEVKGDSAHASVAHADSVKSDSAHVDSAAHGAVAAPAPTVAASAPAAAKGAEKGPEKSAPAAAAHVIPVSAPVKNIASTAHADSTQKVLAKVFASMQAPNAAHILQQMDDGDVQIILASLSPKQQAAILGQFPAQRAATIAKATLRGQGGDQ